MEGLTFACASTTASDPHASIQESISLVASFEFNGHSELVLIGGDLIRLDIIVQAFEDLLVTGPPAFRSRGDICWWIVVGLE